MQFVYCETLQAQTPKNIMEINFYYFIYYFPGLESSPLIVWRRVSHHTHRISHV